MSDFPEHKTKPIVLPEMLREQEEEPPTDVTDVRGDAKLAASPNMWVLQVVDGPRSGLVLPLTTQRTVIGRGSDAHLNLDEEQLSRLHAELLCARDELTVRDLGSTNGTYVNGKLISGVVGIHDGDRLQFGTVKIRVVFQTQAEVESAQRLFDASARDPVTGLANRRYMEERLRSEFAFSQRHRQPLSLIQVHVDRIAEIRTQKGRMAREALLRIVAEFLRGTLRHEDVAARFTNDRFILLLRRINAPGAQILAERLRKGIEDIIVPWQGETLQSPVSIGVVSYGPTRPYAGAEAMLELADECVRRAVATGGNLVIADGSPHSVPPPG